MQHLLSICDVQHQVLELLEIAHKFKNIPLDLKPLQGKTLAMIFEKPSTRTRISFEVGMNQLGGTGLYLSTNDLQIGRGEPITDTARTLSRYVDGIMIRARRHEEVVELAKNSTVPVINGLTNLEHPCQALADMQTIKEYKGNFKGKLLFAGDGNNVCNSLLLICAILGMDMTVACPPEYEPSRKIMQKSQLLAEKSGALIETTSDINSAIEDSDVIYTDVWVSMGKESEMKERNKIFKPYQVNDELMAQAKKDAIFMHCLPAIRGQETTASVIDGPQSVVWDQAENRLHSQKAILFSFLKK